MNPAWWTPVAAFLLGSIPFGYLIVRLTQGRDVRREGSGNIGAANVARTSGKAAGVITLLLDAAKGYFAVWIAGRWTGGSVRWISIAALAAVAGHMFSPWLGFHGGKGVATGLGVFSAICPEAVGAALVIWVVMMVFWRYISLASISAAAAMPLLIYLFYAPPLAPPAILSASAVAIAALIILRHRSNFERLMAGTESRFSFRSKP